MADYARYKLIFNRKKRLNSDGAALLQLEISLAGKRKYISTGIYLRPDQWDSRTSRIIKKNNSSFLMNEISKIIRRCEDYEAQQRYNDRPVTLSALAAVARQEGQKDDFLAFMDESITRAQISYHAKLHHLTTLKALRNYGRIRTFRDLTVENIEDFNAWLLEKGLAVNTIANYHKHLKTHINHAIRRDLFDAGKNPYLKYRVRRQKKSRDALTMDELTRLEQLDISGMDDALEYVRDLFLFSCYTGLRFSDIMALRSDHLIQGEDGIHIRITPEKTSDMSGAVVSLPLAMLFDGRPQEILKKYKSRARVFPPITNQHVNRYLKALAVAAKINRRITFHMARHTFGTILANKTGDPFLIKSLMGHSKIETSMLYIHESQAGNEEKLRKISW